MNIIQARLWAVAQILGAPLCQGKPHSTYIVRVEGDDSFSGSRCGSVIEALRLAVE